LATGSGAITKIGREVFSVNKALVPCGCNCHVLQVEDWRTTNEEEPEVFLNVLYAENVMGSRSLANRLRGAWKLLRGDYESVHEVVLESESIRQLSVALAKALEMRQD
jgi:hypothetical protein